MKKLLIILSAALSAAFSVFVIYPHYIGIPVSVSRWDEQHDFYEICRAEDLTVQKDSTYRTACFESGKSLSKLAGQNEDYVGRIRDPYATGGTFTVANLYFHDNAYYILYDFGSDTDNGMHTYMAQALYCKVSLSGEYDRYVPFPMWAVGFGHIPNDDAVEEIFENLTFEELCEFYERFTDGTAEIYYENQKIKVDACDMFAEEKYSKVFCIDYKNGRFVWDEGGEEEVILGI
ncbi:MAG: hypothetical protein LUE29_08840 [Lachnospiraceae bacterium]|nr:hypothetical protein [Lachnospiraceae bacterium]